MKTSIYYIIPESEMTAAIEAAVVPGYISVNGQNLCVANRAQEGVDLTPLVEKFTATEAEVRKAKTEIRPDEPFAFNLINVITKHRDQRFGRRIVEDFLNDNRNDPLPYTPEENQQLLQGLSDIRALLDMGDVQTSVYALAALDESAINKLSSERKHIYLRRMLEYMGQRTPFEVADGATEYPTAGGNVTPDEGAQMLIMSSDPLTYYAIPPAT
mgnify:CR=1 FL=1